MFWGENRERGEISMAKYWCLLNLMWGFLYSFFCVCLEVFIIDKHKRGDKQEWETQSIRTTRFPEVEADVYIVLF